MSETNVAQELESRAQALFAEASRYRLNADIATKQAEILAAAAQQMAEMNTEIPIPDSPVYTIHHVDVKSALESVAATDRTLTSENHEEIFGPKVYAHHKSAGATTLVRAIPLAHIIKMGSISHDMFFELIHDMTYAATNDQIECIWKSMRVYLRDRLGWTITNGVPARGRTCGMAVYSAPNALPMPRSHYTPTERALFADLNLV
jgi:hypothetical protein